MNESSLTSSQVAILFGSFCLASAIATGLLLKKLQSKNSNDFDYKTSIPGELYNF